MSYVFLIETLSFSVFLQLLSFQEILPVDPMIVNIKMYYDLIRCLRILPYTSSHHQIPKSPLRKSNYVLYHFVIYLPFVVFQICRSYVIHLLKNQVSHRQLEFNFSYTEAFKSTRIWLNPALSSSHITFPAFAILQGVRSFLVTGTCHACSHSGLVSC